LPSLNSSEPECIIIFIDAVGPIVSAKVLPESFNRIELWRVRRQRYNGNIWRQFEVLAGVKAGLIPDHYNVTGGVGLFFKFTKKGIHRIRIEVRTHKANAEAGARTDSAEDISVAVLPIKARYAARILTARLRLFSLRKICLSSVVV
jgi:hypothetical protein